MIESKGPFMEDKTTGRYHILVVEDNETMREGITHVLKKKGYNVSEASGGIEGLSQAKSQKPDIVITDYKMTDLSGMELLDKIKEVTPETEVIVITAYGTIEVAVEAMKKGARDFITKPFSKDELILKVDRICHLIEERFLTRQLKAENRYLRDQDSIRFNYGEIVGDSLLMRNVYRTIGKVAGNDTTIIIYGESGTGKELVARAIHFNSPRKDSAFIKVNCAALAQGVLESELFGHERGAFSGALYRKKGRFELADRGTLFLDEIGDISVETQVKLLRVLQEKEFERVGGEETIQVNVRIIAATHRDLVEEVRQHNFREDLYYRLHILPIYLPPLRERKEDIPPLSHHFITCLGKDLQKPDLILTEEAIQILTAYDWPGNVRELENVLERAVVLCEKKKIDQDSLSFMMMEYQGTNIAEQSMNLELRLAILEKRLLEQALKATKGVKAKAARLLGIKEGALYYKLEKHNLLEKR